MKNELRREGREGRGRGHTGADGLEAVALEEGNVRVQVVELLCVVDRDKEKLHTYSTRALCQLPHPDIFFTPSRSSCVYTPFRKLTHVLQPATELHVHMAAVQSTCTHCPTAKRSQRRP